MTDNVNDSKPVQIEYENDDNDEKEENENETKQEEPTAKQEQETKQTIPRKRIEELTEIERAQLIAEAQQGKENEYYHVKLFKNGKTKITLKKQTKSQELIKSNESNPERITPTTPQTRYLTDNQLLFEHIINLESQYNKLHSKHKKLKKRYNELEGYLYADDSDDEPKPKQKQIEQIQQQQQPIQQQQQQQQPIQQQQQQQTPYIQRRYVRSWRDLRPQ